MSGKKVTREEEEVLWVDWDGPEDPANPKNWTDKKKWVVTFVLSCYCFITPISSSMVAPATEQIAKEFGVTEPLLIAMMTSIFILGYSIGPLVIGPLSEIYGRMHVLQLSYIWYLVWNIACGFAKNNTQLIVFRLLSGFGGSAPLAIGGAVIGDTWDPEQRGKAIGIYSAAPLLGPVIGPVCGGWIAEKSTWRWVFWSTSIVAAAIQVLGMVFFCETFAPYLLEKKAKRIAKSMDSEQGSQHKAIRTIYEATSDRSWQYIFKNAMTRPFQLFAQETIIQVLGLYMGFVYGLFYLYLTQIPSIFTQVYQEQPGIQGLHYIALGTGVTLASLGNANFMDKVYIYFKNTRGGGVGEPEYRLPSMMVGSLILPVGLFLSGWSAQLGLHWAITDLGMAFVGGGMILVFQSIQAYVVDGFTLYAASALASVTTVRSLAGFGFPLFAPAMYAKLGYGRGDTLLACLAIGLGCPAPILLWKHGKAIRMGSKYAHKPFTHGPASKVQNGTEPEGKEKPKVTDEKKKSTVEVENLES